MAHPSWLLWPCREDAIIFSQSPQHGWQIWWLQVQGSANGRNQRGGSHHVTVLYPGTHGRAEVGGGINLALEGGCGLSC